MMKTISVQKLRALIENGGAHDLIDVRTPAEFAGVHVPGARLLPLDDLDCGKVLAERNGNFNAPLYILCHSGARATRAAEKFVAAGFNNCVVVEGGTQAWSGAGFPLVRGERAVLSLDRQMQITIGLMVLTGILLFRFVDPAGIWLSVIAGCGLFFAGLTGICPLRIVVARMPWNQKKECSGSCCCGA